MNEIPPSELDQTLTEAPVTAAQTVPSPPPAPGLPDVPGHSIIKELGRGGMGVVYLARQEQLKRLVALKMILSGSLAGPEEVARFRREAESAARLQHANIVAVHEIGVCNGLPFFSLEYIEGGSLADSLDGKPVSPRSAAELVEVLARAVHHAHQHGIIHRDLKPANVLLAVNDASRKRSGEQRFCEASLNGCVLKITDFGLAKQLDDSSQSRSGAIVGTPSYMAPEQARGDTAAVGTAADVYALGAILYEMLSGRPPFRGTTIMETLEQVCGQEPVTPSRLQPGCPRDLETICLKCLRKEPAQRYGSAEALADDLRRFLAGEPILARPVGAAERLWKWARRRPAVAALATSTLLTAVLGFVLVALWWREAEAAKQTAETAMNAEATARLQEASQRRRAVDALEESRRSQYFTNIAFAFQAWSANDIGKMEELLSACPPDLRRWEWQHGLRRCRDGLLTLRPGGDPVHAVAFSPDGRRLAAGAGDPLAPGSSGVIRVWELGSGAEPLRLSGHTGAVTALHFLPDGNRIVSASIGVEFIKGIKEGEFGPRGQVKIWDLKALKLVRTLRDVYGSASLTADGEHLATAAIDGTVQVYAVRTGQVEQSFERLDGVVTSVAISPDGVYVAAAAPWLRPNGTFGSEVRVWDARQKKLAFSFRLARVEVGTLAFSPDGKRVAWGGSGGRVEVREAATGRLLLPLAGHTEAVAGVAFDASGKRLATISSDRSAKLWDAETGLVLSTFRGHSARVTALGFDPAGKRLATGGRDGLVKVWDAVAGPAPLRLRGHTQGVRHVCFSPDGQLASCGRDGKVLLWQPRSANKPRMLDCDAERLAFSPDGRQMAAAIGSLTRSDQPGVVEIWDVRELRKRHRLTGHPLGVLSVAYSPDGKLLASVSGDPTVKPPRPGKVMLWDTSTHKSRLFDPEVGVVYSLAFSPDGRQLALAGTEGVVSLRDVAENNREVGRLTGHRGWAHSVAFSPDGHTLVSGDSSGRLRSWEPASGRLLHTWKGHAGIVYSLAFSPDGRRLASTGLNPLAGGDEVKLWEPVTRREILTLPGRVVVAFSPDGNLLAAPGAGGLDAALEVRVWDGTPTGEVFTLRADAGRALCVAFSPDGKTLASGHDGGVLKLWDRQTGRELLTRSGHSAQIVDVAFSPDGKLIATAGWDKKVHIWEVATGKRRPGDISHEKSATGVAFSPDGRTLASSGADRWVNVWRVEDGKKLHKFKHGDWAWGVAWSPDGRRLAASGKNRTVKVWDLAGGSPRELSCPAMPISVAFSPDGKRLAAALGTSGNVVLVWEGEGRPRSFSGHGSAVSGVAFSPDGRRLVSGSFDRTVRVWDVASGRSHILTGHADIVRKVAWSPDGRSFASASFDGTVKVWDAELAR